MTLQEIYIRLYNFTVTEHQDCLLVGFRPKKVDFIIKEVHNSEPLKQNEIELLFAELSNVGEQCDCTELRILAYGGWVIDSKTLSQNPYQYQGKTIYSTEYLHSLLSGRHIELFAHNEYAIKKVKEGFQNTRIGAVVQATGTGKSFILSRIISELPLSKKILIIAPSVVIFEEIKKALRLEYGNIDYRTFQSLGKENTDCQNYDYILIDEFHHSESKVWGNAIAKLFAFNENAYVLGTSATPLRPSDKINVVETVFEGHLFHEFNLSDAITFGVLAQPKVVQSVYNLNEIVETYSAQLKKNYDSISHSRRELIEARIHGMRTNFEPIQVSKIIKKHIPLSASHLFVFCSNIEELLKMKKEVLSWFSEAGFSDVQSFIVHSELSDKKNLATLEQFQKEREKLSLLFSIDMLSEGLHVRNVDGAIFLRKTSSYIVCLQQLGRTLKAGGKQEPIILDLVNNITNAISYQTVLGTSQFPNDQILTSKKKIDNILKLIVNDKIIENVAEYINNIELLFNLKNIVWDKKYNELIEYLASHNNKYPPSQNNEIGIWVCLQRASFKYGTLTKEKIEKLNAIGFEWDIREARWDVNYKELVQYLNEHDAYPLSSTSLGAWAFAQRQNYKKGVMSTKRVDKLNSIGFDWKQENINPSREVLWHSSYSQFLEYIEKNNNYPPKNSKLDKWVSEQCKRFRKGVMSKEKIDLLNSINFDWGQTSDDIWNTYFEELKSFKKQNDCFPLSTSKLGLWFFNQKKYYKEGKLPQERFNKLSSITSNWYEKTNHSVEQKWDTFFETLKQQLDKNDGIYPISNKNKLGDWANRQRKLFKRGKLSQERIDKLNSIGFNWDFLASQWEEKFNELKQYLYENKGKYPLSNTPLWKWGSFQRKLFKRGKLSQERLEKLHSINFKFGERF